MKNSLQQLLNVYWLRPETALWRELDIRIMSKFKFEAPSLDLGCGDGIFSCIRAGSEFHESFDAFRQVSNVDLEKYFQNVDVFDQYCQGFSAVAIKPPSYKIDIGFDFKSNLLGQAEKLGLYNSLVQGNANNRLPFSDGSFSTIFSNIIYWLDSPSATILEISRILKPGGRCCLLLPNDTLFDYSFYNQLYLKTENPHFKFLELLDRGRFSNNIKHAKSYHEWCRIFDECGLSIDRHSRHLSRLTLQAWDIGLRPLFPVLLEMANELNDQKLVSIKRKFIKILTLFLGPLLELDSLASASELPGFHCFELRK